MAVSSTSHSVFLWAQPAGVVSGSVVSVSGSGVSTSVVSSSGASGLPGWGSAVDSDSVASGLVVSSSVSDSGTSVSSALGWVSEGDGSSVSASGADVSLSAILSAGSDVVWLVISVSRSVSNGDLSVEVSAVPSVTPGAGDFWAWQLQTARNSRKQSANTRSFRTRMCCMTYASKCTIFRLIIAYFIGLRNTPWRNFDGRIVKKC